MFKALVPVRSRASGGDRDPPGERRLRALQLALRGQCPPSYPSRLLFASSLPKLRGVGKRPNGGPSGLCTVSLQELLVTLLPQASL